MTIFDKYAPQMVKGYIVALVVIVFILEVIEKAVIVINHLIILSFAI